MTTEFAPTILVDTREQDTVPITAYPPVPGTLTLIFTRISVGIDSVGRVEAASCPGGTTEFSRCASL